MSTRPVVVIFILAASLTLLPRLGLPYTPLAETMTRLIQYGYTTPSPTVTETVAPTPSITPTPTNTFAPTSSATATSTGAPSNTPSATATPTITNTPVPSQTPSVTPTPALSYLPYLARAFQPTPTPTVTPTPTTIPSATATASPTYTPSPSPTSTPLAGGVEVLPNHSSYRSVLGERRFVIVGELRNLTDSDLDGVRVPITYYGPNGELLTTDDGGTILDTLPAGSVACFINSIGGPESESVARYEIGTPTYILDSRPWRRVSLENAVAFISADGSYVVDGAVSNHSESYSLYASVEVSLYDAAHRVVSCQSESTIMPPEGRDTIRVVFRSRGNYSDVVDFGPTGIGLYLEE